MMGVESAQQNLDLDIGNTFLKWRWAGKSGRLLATSLSKEAFLALVKDVAPARVRIASVGCHDQQAIICQWSLDVWGVVAEVAKTSAQSAGVVNSYQEPCRMGVDRWLAVLAAHNRQQAACCVVDCGSAITIDYVGHDGHHLGGYIMPGLRLLRDSLLSNTQRISVNRDAKGWQDIEPGKNTEDAVDHGVCYLLDSLAKRVVEEYRRDLGADAQLVITGGDGADFYASAGEGQLCPDLVLDGLDYLLP